MRSWLVTCQACTTDLYLIVQTWRRQGFRLLTLRSKLQAAFAIVIIVALGTAAAGTFGLVQRYQRQQAINRLTDVAIIAAVQMSMQTWRQASAADIAGHMSFLAERYGVRILLLDDTNLILADVSPEGDESLQGVQLALADQQVAPARQVAPDRRSGRRSPQMPIIAWTAEVQPLDQPHLFIVAQVPPVAARGRGAGDADQPAPAGAATRRVAVVVPEASLATAWRALAPSLASAALIALAVSAAAALWLSRSIARPLRQITEASRAMAQGDYEQSIPVRGHDEVAQLARAFNRMAREVDRSNRALRAFLANASHELRTPLTSLQGWAQALVEGEVRDPAASAEAGRIIHDEAERMRRLVEALLYLSKIEGGQLPVKREPVDLTELLRVTATRIAPLTDQVGQKLVLDFDADAAHNWHGDARLLERLLANLAENAAKYAPEGATITISAGAGRPPPPQQHPSPAVNGAFVVATDDMPSLHDPMGTQSRPLARSGVVQTQRSDEPERQRGAAAGRRTTENGRAAARPTVWVTVHNTDSVIPAADLPHIFERFYRVEKSRAQGVDGTGLGLAIAQEIVAAHEGEITATSSAEGGTGFTVILPAADGTPGPRDPTDAPAAAPQRSPGERSARHLPPTPSLKGRG